MNMADGREKNIKARTPPTHDRDAIVPIAITNYVDVGPRYW